MKDINEFYMGYVDRWKEELSYAIENLKEYMSEKELESFNVAQQAWGKNLEENREFDMLFIYNNEIQNEIGSIGATNSIYYVINQHRDRTFHIKYLTYLLEKREKVPEDEQLWNKFDFEK
jgi:hypothetical protein